MTSPYDIWAACALSADSFAISIGRMADDPMFSRLCVFSAVPEPRWEYLPLASTIVSMTRLQSGPDGRFAALGIEGDVHYVSGAEISAEQIPEAGNGGKDDDGLGSMSQIVSAGQRLAACGYASQVYVKNAGGDWNRICDEDTDDVGVNSFEAVAFNAAGHIAACGFADPQYREPTEEEEAELERIAETGTMGEYLAAKERFTAMEDSARGSLFVKASAAWREVDVPGNGHLLDIAALSDGRFIAVGSAGMILAGNDPDEFEDFSDDGFSETYHAVAVLKSHAYLLADSCINVLDGDLDVSRSIALPGELNSPVSIDIVDGVLWTFDHQGVALYRNEAWEIIPIPDEAWLVEPEPEEDGGDDE